MRWSNALLFAASSLAAVVAADTPYRPGYAPSPLPDQANNARVHIDPDTACKLADDKTASRHIQLAAWVECQVMAFYPYPRTEAANDTNWVAGFEATFHADARASFNNTRFARDGFLQAYHGFSKAIGAAYGNGWHQWREFYVVSPDSWDPQGRGGVVTATGFHGGLLKGAKEAMHYPNAGYFVVKEIKGRRWLMELREHGTAPSATTLPEKGQLWKCDPKIEKCG